MDNGRPARTLIQVLEIGKMWIKKLFLAGLPYQMKGVRKMKKVKEIIKCTLLILAIIASQVEWF